jgi:hypothetical protein
LTAWVVGLTGTGLHASTEPSAVWAHVEAAPVMSPFSTRDLAEDNPPTTHRLRTTDMMISTTASYSTATPVRGWTWVWPPPDRGGW